MGKIIKYGVLVADPAEKMALLVGAMLRGQGHRMVTMASTAREVQDLLLARSYSLVIIDDALGPPSALEEIRRMRTDRAHPNRTTPIILVSATPSVASIAAARDAGVTEVVKKPFSTADLQKRIEALDIFPRNFIEAPDYAGPDRRRKTMAIGDDDQRQ
jgi:two-component system chemotaxis response regulator CheY